jgi:hypothetical protein
MSVPARPVGSGGGVPRRSSAEVREVRAGLGSAVRSRLVVLRHPSGPSTPNLPTRWSPVPTSPSRSACMHAPRTSIRDSRCPVSVDLSEPFPPGASGCGGLWHRRAVTWGRSRASAGAVQVTRSMILDPKRHAMAFSRNDFPPCRW